MSNRKVPWWVFKQQRAKAKEAAKGHDLAFNGRRPKRNRVYPDNSFEARALRKNDPLQMMKRRVPKTRRPHLPVITKPVPEMLPSWQSPYAPLGGRMPEYLPDNVSPFKFMQTPGLPPRTPEIEKY